MVQSRNVYRVELEDDTLKVSMTDGRIVEIPMSVILAAQDLVEAINACHDAFAGARAAIAKAEGRE